MNGRLFAGGNDMNIYRLVKTISDTCGLYSEPSLPTSYEDVLAAFSGGSVVYRLLSGTGRFTGRLDVFFSEAGAALISADIQVNDELTVTLEPSECFYVSYYLSLDADFLVADKVYRLNPERIYTSAGVKRACRTVYHAGSAVKGMILLVAPDEYLNYFRGDHSSEMNELMSCFAHFRKINNYHYLPVLDTIYMQISQFGGRKIFVKIFLESKVHEIISLLSQLVDEALATETSVPPLNAVDIRGIQLVREYISDHLSEDPGNEELAALAHMSQAKLKYTFKAVTGTSIREYRKGLRLALGKELLKTTSLSCSEVATRLGFGSLAAFSSFFVAQVGMTPAAWRKGSAGV